MYASITLDTIIKNIVETKDFEYKARIKYLANQAIYPRDNDNTTTN